MKRGLAFVYGLVCYLFFLAVFLYAVGFVGNFVVPKTIDRGAEGAFWTSLLIDLGLLGLFGLQHSVMARPGFKRWWTQIVPKPVERSTYVLFASLALALLFWQWRPIPDIVWHVENATGRGLLWGLHGLGWTIVLVGTYMISHAHLFGLKQVHEHLRGQEPSPPAFKAPGFYRHVRHPLMTGFLIAFWATPHMTVGHLVFASGTTGYILVALQFEERDLVRSFGDKYRAYRESVPMLLPKLWPEGLGETEEESAASTEGGRV